MFCSRVAGKFTEEAGKFPAIIASLDIGQGDAGYLSRKTTGKWHEVS